MFRWTSQAGTFLTGLAATAVVLSLAADAEACGGLFCSNSTPVNQAAERIIFSQNDDGTVSAAIEIQYEGPTHSFAWVLPVPAGDVDVGLSSKHILDRLQAASNPIYQLTPVFEESCQPDFAAGSPTGLNSPDPVSEDDAPVNVVESGNTGPYDWVIIEVDPELSDRADVAVDWLEQNEYDVSNIGPDVLRPYLDQDMNLLAVRLSSNSDTGSIRPILLRYPGSQPSIPIRPTAVAANPDMGVLVWVLGPARAVPTSYYHLELNEAMINWFNPGPTYNEVITAAANDAGGQGFVTEQSGPASAFDGFGFSLQEEGNWERLTLGEYDSLAQFFEDAVMFFGTLDGFGDIVAEPATLPLREGATPEQFLACPSCYFDADVAVRNERYPSTPYVPGEDPLDDENTVLRFLERMRAVVIEPLQETERMFDDHETITRLYTTLSPEDMYADPVFDFNDELGPYSNVHVAEQVFLCQEENQWRVELPQGMSVEGNGQQWPVSLDMEEMPVNFRIVQLGTTGVGETVSDNEFDIIATLSDLGLSDQVPPEDDEDDDVTDDDTTDDDDTTEDDDAAPDDRRGAADAGPVSSGGSGEGGGCRVIAAPRTPPSPWWGLPLMGFLLSMRRRSRKSCARATVRSR